MLEAVSKFAAEKGIKGYISMEENMACGVGACLGCTVKTKKGYKGYVKKGLSFRQRILYGFNCKHWKAETKNPVMTASGTFGYGEEYSEFVDLNKLGAIVVKGLSLKPMEGNPSPRIYETPCGMLNAIGLQNVGVKEFLKTKLPYIRNFDTKLIVNIFGNTLQEYVKLSRILDDSGVDGIELNVSCPNIKKAEYSSAQTKNASEITI